MRHALQKITHVLKCWPPQFEAQLAGTKRFELRNNDRDFHVGDTLLLREWDPATEKYTGRECYRDVEYITLGGNFGLPENLCVMGVKATIDSKRIYELMEVERQFHRVMHYLQHLKLEHGKCQPREDRACTHCNAQEKLDEIVESYRGARITCS